MKSGWSEAVYSIFAADRVGAYEAWHLARSLKLACGAKPAGIAVGIGPMVDDGSAHIFEEAGYRLHRLTAEDLRGGRQCAQLAAALRFDWSRIVLLSSATIAIADMGPFLGDAIAAKVVDRANPPLSFLTEIAVAAGLDALPPIRRTDAGDGPTRIANCNGGFYSIPRPNAEALVERWRRWNAWLADRSASLQRIRQEGHLDQIGFWLSIAEGGLPFEPAPANVNYYVHIAGAHHEFDASRPIALLNYHRSSLDALGRIRPTPGLDARARRAVERANRQIAAATDDGIAWLAP